MTTTPPPALCPTCEAHGIRTAMVQVTPKVWICPVQRAEARGISIERRKSIRADAYAIDPACGF
jgi:hypothetical protein